MYRIGGCIGAIYKESLVPGTLRAYDANNVTNEIYNSDQSGSRDLAGSFVKFLSPVVANGRVYLGNRSNSLQVYGLLCQANEMSSVAVTRGTLHKVPKSNQLTQQLTVTNIGTQSIGGPFSVAITQLPSGVTVVAPAGYTSCSSPAGNPFVTATAAPLRLQAGRSFSVSVTFEQAGNAAVIYTPAVLASSGGQ